MSLSNVSLGSQGTEFSLNKFVSTVNEVIFLCCGLGLVFNVVWLLERFADALDC